MSFIETINVNPQGDPVVGKPLEERQISGDPVFKTWLQSVSNDKIRTGVWEASEGEHVTVKGDAFEFCHILSGCVEITPEGKSAIRYSAGDSFILKPGFVGRWKTIETVRKIFVTVA